MSEQPQPTEVLRTPETEVREAVTPVIARLAFGAVNKERLNPDNQTVTSEDKTALLEAKPFKLRPMLKAAGKASWESANETFKGDGKNFEQRNQEWNGQFASFIKDFTSDQSVDVTIRGERMLALNALGIDPRQQEGEASSGLHQQIENFRARYLHEDADKRDLTAFVWDLSVSCQSADGIVNMDQLRLRLEAMKPLLTVFGKQNEINTLVEELAITNAILSQSGEAKQQAVEAASLHVTRPIYDHDGDNERTRLNALWMIYQNQEDSQDSPKKTSSIDRVVGKDYPDDAKQNILEQIKENIFEVQPPEKNELAKTPDEIAIINLVNAATDSLRQKYGLEPFTIPEQNVHIFDQKAFDKAYTEHLEHFDPRSQGIKGARLGSNLLFASYLMHEINHFKSHGAFQIISGEPGGADMTYRLGIQLNSRDGQTTFFNAINEAVTEELAKQFIQEEIRKNNPLFSQEIQLTEQLRREHGNELDQDDKPLFTDDMILARLNSQNIIESHKFARSQERQILYTLQDKLYEANKDHFPNKEAVFDEFAKAMFTGNIWPVGRMIERTFGKGTFRKIGETTDLAELQQYVNNLTKVEAPAPPEPSTGEQLTTELARSDPERFKTLLIQKLGEKHPLAYQAWEQLIEQGELSPEKVMLKNNQYLSHTDGTNIELGTSELPEELKRKIIFDHSTFTYEDEILYRFAHEFSHKLAYKLTNADDVMGRMYTTLTEVRRNGDRGFSGLGSLDHYQGAETKAKEDITELINMYLWDPDYLNRYTNYLSDPTAIEERRSLGLVTVSQESSITLNSNIENALQIWLQNAKTEH